MFQKALILPLALVLALVLGLEHSEQGKISVQLSRRDNGKVLASLYIANATWDLFENSSLSLDIDTFMDKSDKLIGASGYLKETNRNETIELTCDSTSKDQAIQECQLSKEAEISVRDEEINALRLQNKKERDEEIQRWSFLCPEEGEELLSIVPGDDRGYEEKYVRENRTQVADFLIVDGHTLTAWNARITGRGAADKQNCNFFVSDDGKVYEGIGWNKYNYRVNGGLGSKSLIIGFIKESRDGSPSDEALKTFKKLVRRAVCSNVLSPHYSVIPFYLIVDRFNISEQSFERNGMTEWVGYKNNLDFLIPSNEKGAQPIVSKLERSGTKERDELKISTPIEYLVVDEFRQRCFFSCENYLKTLLSNYYVFFMYVNFFLAEDGRAYEHQGWEGTWESVYQEKKAVVVMFMGYFNTYRPNKRIFDAFEGLIEEGLRLGKLSPEFKIVVNEVPSPKSSRTIGKFLKKEIRNHPRFSETFDRVRSRS